METIPGREKISEENMKTILSEQKVSPVPARGGNIEGGLSLKRKMNVGVGNCLKRKRNAGGGAYIKRKRIAVMAAVTILSAASVAAGIFSGPDGKDMPVVLANGEVITPPWYISVDGERVAIVESKEAAEKTIGSIVEKYEINEAGKNEIMDIEIVEETKTEKMKLHHGDEPPEILTVAQAEDKLTNGNHGEGYLTVVTVEQEVKEETIEFKEEYKAEPTLYVGEKQVETAGQTGSVEVTKKIVRENGEIVGEKIIEEEILQQPVQQIVLTGTKNHDGYGGSDGDYRDEGVSCDFDATYEKLRIPVGIINVSSGYGQRWGRLHRGTDFALARGNSIYAADGGTVYFAGNGGGYGNLVKIDHGNGMQTYYAHCSRLLVSDGQQVVGGEEIALVGSTGNSTGPHLHFEVIINGSCVDPLSVLDL